MAHDVVVVEPAVVDEERRAGELGAPGAGGQLGAQLPERSAQSEVEVLTGVHRDGHPAPVVVGDAGVGRWRGRTQ